MEFLYQSIKQYIISGSTASFIHSVKTSIVDVNIRFPKHRFNNRLQKVIISEDSSSYPRFIKMHEAFVNICGIPTHIMTWGRWIEESLDDVKEIAICITGNPGLPGFYTEFLGSLHERLESKMPVWVIGHLGHDDPVETSIRQVPELKGNEESFNLNGQIKHKIEFIKNYVPANVKIHLIGHSIGAWMILQMLEDQEIKNRVRKCYMLFPTIERMIDSPNGWIFTKIALPLYSVFGFVITIFNKLPNIIKILLVHIYFWFASIPTHFIGTALKYAKETVSEKVIFLAEDEMMRVRGLQADIIKANLHKLKFFYGTTDGWVPVKYYKQLRESFPDIDAELDMKKIDHAFVLRHSNPMGVIVGDMITQNSDFL